MTEIGLQHLDIHLIRVFLALYEEESVTRAAARLNITPSAISHSLGRLRLLFDDPLFVRRASGMSPTGRAADIGPRVRAAMLQLEQAVLPSIFDPAACTRRFVLVVPPYLARLILPPLMARFCAEAPRAEIRVRPRSQSLADDFEARHVDLALLPTVRVGNAFASELLMSDRWVWVLPRHHPSARAPLTLEALAAIPHVVVTPGREAMLDWGAAEAVGPHRLGDDGAFEAALAARGLARKVSLNVPDSMTALAVAAQSGHATLVPRALVAAMADFYGLSLFDPPNPTPPIETRMAWRHEGADEPGAMWLRDMIREAAREVEQGTSKPNLRL